MRITLEPKYAKAPLENRAKAALCEALNALVGAVSFKWDDTGVRVGELTVGISLDDRAICQGRHGAVLSSTDDPRTFNVELMTVGKYPVPLPAYASLMSWPSSGIWEAERQGMLQNQAGLRAEITRLLEVIAMQQEEHRAELATTRELLAATQEKLRDARRKLAGLSVDPKP